MALEKISPENIFASGWTTWLNIAYKPSLAFDGISNKQKNGWMPADKYNAYIGCTFSEPKKVTSVSLAQGPNIYSLPEKRCKNFSVEYYDGQNWIAAYSDVLPYNTAELQNFSFDSAGKYSKWRIMVHNSHGTGYVGLGEVEFYEDKTDNKFYFNDNNLIKTFDITTLSWRSIKLNKNSKSISSMDNLIQNTTKSIKAPKTTTTEAGSQFSKPVNLKSFKTISNISII